MSNDVIATTTAIAYPNDRPNIPDVCIVRLFISQSVAVDVNQDGVVDQLDIFEVQNFTGYAFFLGDPSPCPFVGAQRICGRADVNFDGFVDILDVTAIEQAADTKAFVIGVTIPKSPLALAAGQVSEWYSVAERRLVCEQVLDAAHTLLTNGETVVINDTTVVVPISSKSLNSVAAAVRHAVTLLQILDGKATEIVENRIDQPEIVALIDEYRSRNDAHVRQLRSVPDKEATA